MNRLLGFVAAVALGSSVAVAQLPDFQFTVETVGGGTWNAWNDPNSWTAEYLGGDKWSVVGGYEQNGVGMEFNMELDTDPFISNAFTLTNNTGSTQTFIVNVSLVINPAVPAPSQLFGSISGAIVDKDGIGGALVSALPGEGLYNPLLDGAVYGPGQLLLDPYSQTAPVGGTNVIGPANFSDNNGPAVLVDIGIRNRFELSPGDSVSLVSTLNVVPEPASLVLLALGGLFAARRR